MKFLIAQCLCGPDRHAILALGQQDSGDVVETHALLRTAVAECLAGNGAALGLPAKIDPWCGLCGSRAWIFEVGWSIDYPDWDTAQRALRESEAEQRFTSVMAHLRRMGIEH